MKKGLQVCVLVVGVLFSVLPCVQAQEAKIATSFDGSEIAYTVYGEGARALVFVHGWSCDQSYWREQVAAFSENYTVVTIDLAGHGDSSQGREEYILPSFGEDVKVVVEQESLDSVVLLGHSMGGGVIAHAAYLMPDRVIAIIGVDTLHNVAHPFTQEEMDGMIAPFYEDFPPAVVAFAGSMFPENADAALVESVCADMSAAPPAVAINAISNYLSEFVAGEFSDIFTKLEIPVYAINTRMWPTESEENRKHMKSFEVRYVEDAGHFLMLEKPEAFNAVLHDLLQEIA